MTDKPARETSKQQAARLRQQARTLINQRALNSDEADNALDEMVRRNIQDHGA